MRNDNKKLYAKLKASRDRLENSIVITSRGYGKTNMTIENMFTLMMFNEVLHGIETSETKITQEDVLNIMRQYGEVREIKMEATYTL